MKQKIGKNQEIEKMKKRNQKLVKNKKLKKIENRKIEKINKKIENEKKFKN